MCNFNWKNVKSEKIKGKYINPFNNTDKSDLCQDFTNTYSFITCNILMHVFFCSLLILLIIFTIFGEF